MNARGGVASERWFDVAIVGVVWEPPVTIQPSGRSNGV